MGDRGSARLSERPSPAKRPVSQSNNLSMLRDFIALSGGELLSRILGFVAFAHLARVLTPDSYGAVEIAVTLSLLFGFVVDFGIGPIGAREIARDPTRSPALAAEIPAARLLVALLAIPAMGLAAIALGQPPETVQLVWLFALGLLAAPWRNQWLLQGHEMMTWVSGAAAIRALVFALGVALLVREPSDLSTIGIVEIASAGVLAAYFLWVQRARLTPPRLSFSPRALRALFGEGLPLGLTQLVWSSTQYVPTMLVAGFLGGSEIAWFGAAHRIVMSIWAFSFLYHFNLFPTLARCLAGAPETFAALLRASINVTAWSGLGLSLVITLLATPLCALVFGERFAVAGPVLSVGIWVVPATLLSGHARSVLVASGLQRFVLYAQLSGGVVMLLGGFLLIPRSGTVGGAIAMVASSLVTLLVSHSLATRWVTAMPLLRQLLGPVAAVGLATIGVRAASFGPWWDGVVAGAIFSAAALIFDRRLRADLRLLVGARGLVAQADESSVDSR